MAESGRESQCEPECELERHREPVRATERVKGVRVSWSQKAGDQARQ